MFNFYSEYYGYYIGTQVRGTIGKSWVYQVVHGQQKKYAYFVPTDNKTPAQISQRTIFKKAVQSWQQLSAEQKNIYRKKEPFTPTMSGYNYYISQYIKSYQ